MSGAENVLMYRTAQCPFCLMADRLLAGKLDALLRASSAA